MHERAIRTHSPGESLAIRDAGLLESAVMAPQHTWGGEYLYPTVAEMAAQYLISLNQNHAFENGNKRAGFAACAVFLRLNGYHLGLTPNGAAELTLAVASHSIERDAVIAQIMQGLENISSPA
ncbi:death-on-curing protein [Capsulimonas corticalis]|uniref:Death-on-curing protein n=1 Tax=Capsulimonas corticalis TaxID=2219043 RepID=A0A402CRU6_9BACT|nr:death-on-curing protein [Capsulimonas corticalis]